MIIILFTGMYCAGQNGKLPITKAMDEVIEAQDSYFEVTKSMFQMLSEAKGASPEYKEYIRKIHSLKMVQPGRSAANHGKLVLENFMSQVNLQPYKRLMTKKEQNSELHFYKKTNKTENEFLLASTEMIIYITGTIDLKSIGEFEQVMEVAGSAFDM